MAVTRTGFNIIFTSGVEDPVSAALDLGTNPGKLVAGFISVNNAYQVFSAGVDGGDDIPLIDMEVIDGFKRYGFAGVVTQTGLQSIIFDTDAPVGQGKWGQVASYDGASGVRAGGAVYGFASGVNPSVNLTGMTAGDMMLMLGISNGAAQPLSPAGGATDFDGGAADSVALQKVAGGASDTIAGTWGAPSAAYVLALAIAPIPGADTAAPNITSTGAGSTNGPFSVNVAENSSTVAVNLTSDEALGTVTKGGASGASYTLAGTGLTRTLARNAPGFNYEDWVLAGSIPEVVTLTFSDTATPTPNERTVTINFSPTNVVEAPNAPTIGTATAGDQTITVPFTPGAAGSMPSTIDFEVVLSPGAITKTVLSSPAVFTSGDGVVNGVARTATVRARNSDGFSSPSAASNSVTPSAALGPTLSAPTKSTPSATTAVGGFTTSGIDGVAHMVWTTSPVQPNETQVKAGQNHLSVAAISPPDLTITGAGAKTFASVTVTQGVTYYGYVVHTNGLGVDSAVFALGRVFPGTGRAVADVTTAGWTGSAAGALCDLINEDVRNDANFISSPALSAIPSGVTFELNQTYTPGTYSGPNAFQIALWTDTGTGVARVKFLDNASTVVGQTADQAVNTTPTLYSLPVTLTANATRWMLEVNA